MNMTSDIRPFLGLALVITGCGRTEIEYHHSSKAKVVDASKPTDEGTHQWHENAEALQTTFRLAVVGRQSEEPKATKPLESVAAPSTQPTSDSKSVVTVDVGAINIHVGDVHHHTHVHTTTIVHAPPQKVIIQESIREPNQSMWPRASANSERCGRLRREHEAREAQWNSLFDRH